MVLILGDLPLYLSLPFWRYPQVLCLTHVLLPLLQCIRPLSIHRPLFLYQSLIEFASPLLRSNQYLGRQLECSTCRAWIMRHAHDQGQLFLNALFVQDNECACGILFCIACECVLSDMSFEERGNLVGGLA